MQVFLFVNNIIIILFLWFQEYYCRRSGQIPAFGDWDYSNEMPITQYFESARQAGLLRYSSSSGESDLYIRRGCGGGDLYAVNYQKPPRNVNVAPPRKVWFFSPTVSARIKAASSTAYSEKKKKQHQFY